MPNFQTFNALSTTGEHTLFARTVRETPEDSSVIFQTTRGAHVWLDPADQRALIEWLHHQLGDTTPATFTADDDGARSELFVTGHRCVAVAPESRARCELWTGHKDAVNGARPNHQARSGETW